MRKIIKTKLLIYCLTLFIMLTGCNSSSRITAEDEPVILFAIAEPIPEEVGLAIIYVDNKGNIYYEYVYESILTLIEEERLGFDNCVGQIPAEEVIENYNALNEIPEEVRMIHLDVCGAPMEDPRQYFMVITYDNNQVEIKYLWEYSTAVMVLEGETAKDVVLWMDSWTWELEKEGWDAENKQWYPYPDVSDLKCASWYFNE